MKPFNLEAAKAGNPLVTRDGRKVTEFYRFETKNGQKNTAVIDGELRYFSDNGAWMTDERDGESRYDLFLAGEEVTVWVNVFEGQSSDCLKSGYILHKTKEEAEKEKQGLVGYIGAFPLTIKL